MIKTRIGIIIPYRKRKKQLLIFLSYIKNHLKNVDYHIYIIKQSNDLPFNRGILNNIGAQICFNFVDFICIHDVDLLPYPNTKYNCSRNTIQQISGYTKDDDDGLNYHEAIDFANFDKLTSKWNKQIRIGGQVTIIEKNIFKTINGYPNDYFGWGKEDNLFHKRASLFNIKYNICNYKFINIKHPKQTHQQLFNHYLQKCKEFIRRSIVRYNYKVDLFRLSKKNIMNNGYNSIVYDIKNSKLIDKYTTKINVDFPPPQNYIYYKAFLYIFLTKICPILFLFYLYNFSSDQWSTSLSKYCNFL